MARRVEKRARRRPGRSGGRGAGLAIALALVGAVAGAFALLILSQEPPPEKVTRRVESQPVVSPEAKRAASKRDAVKTNPPSRSAGPERAPAPEPVVETKTPTRSPPPPPPAMSEEELARRMAKELAAESVARRGTFGGGPMSKDEIQIVIDSFMPKARARIKVVKAVKKIGARLGATEGVQKAVIARLWSEPSTDILQDDLSAEQVSEFWLKREMEVAESIDAIRRSK